MRRGSEDEIEKKGEGREGEEKLREGGRNYGRGGGEVGDIK